MTQKILVSSILQAPVFASEAREQGLQALSQLGELVEEPPELTVEHAEGVVASIAGGSRYTEDFYRAAKDLRIVARWGVGYDQVNVAAATEHGVIITVTPVHMDTVAEYTITQWLATLKRTYTLNLNSHAGDFAAIRTYEAQGSTLGLYGCGRIGQEVAKRARPLLGPTGRLLIYDLRPDIAEIAAKYDATVVDHPRALFEESDTVSLHVSGDETIVDYDLLCAMKPHASLINPSRGNLVNDEAANRAIEEKRLCYYVVDDPVNGPRAIHKDNPRIICTNHNGGITVESVIRLDQTTFAQVTDTVHGRRPDHILNPEVLEHPKVKGFLTG
jgi:lactate dehydrogenase-like 2-hydroxyacid dehydrogenase